MSVSVTSCFTNIMQISRCCFQNHMISVTMLDCGWLLKCVSVNMSSFSCSFSGCRFSHCAITVRVYLFRDVTTRWCYRIWQISDALSLHNKTPQTDTLCTRWRDSEGSWVSDQCWDVFYPRYYAWLSPFGECYGLKPPPLCPVLIISVELHNQRT